MKTGRNISRRHFLGMAGLAAAAPMIVPARVFGANDRIGVGYIGAGRRARQLMRLPKGMEMAAVCDLFQERTDEVARAKKCKGYHDYDELLADPAVDAIVTATPDHWHAKVTIDSCKAGKHVYVEKPMTLTIVEGRQMTEAARKYDRVVQCGSQQRSMKECRRGCELVRNGYAGEIKVVHGANYPSPWECALPEQPVPEGLQWDEWCGQTTPRPYHIDLFLPRAQGRTDEQGRRLGWISYRPYSGGEMTGWGAHGLDIIQWALGMDESGPVEVWPEGEGLFAPVSFKYANGTVVKLDDKGTGGGGVFEGTEGTIEIERGKYRASSKEIENAVLKESDVHLPKSDDHMDDFQQAIRQGARPIADVETAHRSTTVCHLGNIARWTGRHLKWDPKAEAFVDDDEANALRAREQREGYEITV